mmetsp:Transcript_28564/g.91502  ORF Transcript_28564/g.91502 Transcript_28564/m.91502 type:complete len:397 (+) Transcript_28564:2-1192(+)
MDLAGSRGSCITCTPLTSHRMTHSQRKKSSRSLARGPARRLRLRVCCCRRRRLTAMARRRDGEDDGSHDERRARALVVGERLAQNEVRPDGAKDGRHRKPELRVWRRRLSLPVGLEPGRARAGEEGGGEQEAELLRREAVRPSDQLGEDGVCRLGEAARLLWQQLVHGLRLVDQAEEGCGAAGLADEAADGDVVGRVVAEVRREPHLARRIAEARRQHRALAAADTRRQRLRQQAHVGDEGPAGRDQAKGAAGPRLRAHLPLLRVRSRQRRQRRGDHVDGRVQHRGGERRDLRERERLQEGAQPSKDTELERRHVDARRYTPLQLLRPRHRRRLGGRDVAPEEREARRGREQRGARDSGHNYEAEKHNDARVERRARRVEQLDAGRIGAPQCRGSH